jgi:hypothetical protein
MADGERLRVLYAEDLLLVGLQRLEDRDCLVDTPGRLVGEGKPVAAVERIRVLSAEDSHTIGQQHLEDRDCLADTPGRLIRVGEAMAGVERVRVLCAEDPHTIGQQHVQDGDRLADTPDGPEASATPWRALSVWGCSGPRTRSLSASNGS